MNSQLHNSNSVEVALGNLKDSDLLLMTKSLVQREREITTQVLKHLAEIERRKLYCDLKCGSLFEYAVRELKYSEGAAARRIQAMRLMAEIPEVESKIESGALNLTNICQAQSYFREQKKSASEEPLNKTAKLEILEKLEQKSSREGERILLELGGPQALPREKIRLVAPELVEMSFLADSELQTKLEKVRALLGARGTQMNLAELVTEMAKLSAERLCEQRFGKRRVLAQAVEIQNYQVDDSGAGVRLEINSEHSPSRYISQAIKHQVWQRAEGKCSCCGSKANLQFDHIQPFALGGESRAENLRLLCRSCNLRGGVKTFGLLAMKRDPVS